MPVEDATTGVLLPSVEAKIVDEEGNVLPRNEKGNVYTRTPFVMEGYLNDPVNTAQTIMEDGWIRTGDIGWADEEGRFYIVGRRKACLIIEYSLVRYIILTGLGPLQNQRQQCHRSRDRDGDIAESRD